MPSVVVYSSPGTLELWKVGEFTPDAQAATLPTAPPLFLYATDIGFVHPFIILLFLH